MTNDVVDLDGKPFPKKLKIYVGKDLKKKTQFSRNHRGP